LKLVGQAVVPAPTAWEVVTGVGVVEASALKIEYAVEAGDKRVGRDIGTENLVGLGQRLTGRRSPSLGDGAKDAARAGHHQGRRDPFAGDVADDEPQATVF
jgi:hypothetical protein